VAGFHTWRSVGRFVRKGEKGIAILAPIVRRRCEETQDDESRVIVGFRTAYVFDLEQTDGAPLPQTADVTGDPGEHTPALKRAIAAHGIGIEYAENLGGALGLSCGGCIRVLNGLSAASEFAVLTHEFAHELLHRSHDRPESRDTRELEAEAVASSWDRRLALKPPKPLVITFSYIAEMRRRWQHRSIEFSEPRPRFCSRST
jgi:antirestriction protein ArdC